ncbi:hypothetical protein [Rhizobium sp. H4]|uniref:hypothetical protein n=1 Tax=Rhizobium sp. H4 TaxID=2035449 RepID=UPI001FE18231|nr:hypothetical protein [Rhizobium sp. H4]
MTRLDNIYERPINEITCQPRLSSRDVRPLLIALSLHFGPTFCSQRSSSGVDDIAFEVELDEHQQILPVRKLRDLQDQIVYRAGSINAIFIDRLLEGHH